MSQNFEVMKALLSEVLGVDEGEVKPDSNLIRDLAAESIDFMDIAFQIEQKFGIPDIKPAALFPAFLREQTTIFVDGALVPEIKQRLQAEYPFLRAEHLQRFEKEQTHEIFFDISTILAFVEYRQNLQAAEPRAVSA